VRRTGTLLSHRFSHEMRTPLSAIVGWMQILQGSTGGCGDAELNEGLEVIERNARTLVQLLDDVMARGDAFIAAGQCCSSAK
jgi:signal transduction histidine kinase